MTPDGWTSFQKYLLLTERSEFGLYVRQLKKLSPEILTEIRDGFSAGQIESKLWLLEVMSHVLPAQAFQAHILGSWFGLLSRMMSWFFGARAERLVSYDIDPRWESIAAYLNEPESYRAHAMEFLTADMNRLPYEHFQRAKTIFINTACEHLHDFEAWYRLIPPGTLLVLQGNDFAHADHATTWKTLDAFAAAAPMTIRLFEGSLPLPKYQRYMLIGVK